MKRPTGQTVGDMNSLAHLYELALTAQRPDNICSGLKLLEALRKCRDFQPITGSKA